MGCDSAERTGNGASYSRLDLARDLGLMEAGERNVAGELLGRFGVE